MNVSREWGLMSLSVATEILEACLARLADFADQSPPVLVAWPGIEFNPPSTGRWLEARLFPNEPRDLAWDDNSCHDMFGFFQVNVYYRPGTGQVTPSQLADDIIAYFPKGLVLGPVRVEKRGWQSPAVTDEDKLFIPVTIRWRGITE